MGFFVSDFGGGAKRDSFFRAKKFLQFQRRPRIIGVTVKCSDAVTWPKTGSSPPSFEFYERDTFYTHRGGRQPG
jgi:hypothetical protein